ncbi:MAG TPA: hypothetical protein VG937_05875 [Polyangiaceae bacterium]|nr:hypothetical protein [Polyangiaceae bacterium]
MPALDVRENAVIGFWPGMQQSMALCKDSYYLVHGAFLSFRYPEWMPEWLGDTVDVASLVALDSVLVYVPPADGWMHEEWHRAVMSRRGIDSYNDVYKIPIGANLINVSHVRDEDLVRLKRNHPAEQVRLSAAGIEGDLTLGLEFDKDRFFAGTRAGTLVTQWLTTLNVIAYMSAAAFHSDATTERQNQKEGSNVAIRDFTGLDPDGWVYDLFRPDEPYEARGVHPSGVGIDRYRSESDLTRRERRYLRSQAYLSWLNLLNPQLFGLYEFELGRRYGQPVTLNASVQHMMAPFGYSLGLNLFGKVGRYGAFGELRAFVSEARVLPGLGAELVRYPLPWLDATVSPRVQLWLQPQAQRFFAHAVSPGGALGLRANLPIYAPFELYLDASAKTAGWVPGNVFLGPSLNLRSGVEVRL